MLSVSHCHPVIASLKGQMWKKQKILWDDNNKSFWSMGIKQLFLLAKMTIYSNTSNIYNRNLIKYAVHWENDSSSVLPNPIFMINDPEASSFHDWRTQGPMLLGSAICPSCQFLDGASVHVYWSKPSPTTITTSRKMAFYIQQHFLDSTSPAFHMSTTTTLLDAVHHFDYGDCTIPNFTIRHAILSYTRVHCMSPLIESTWLKHHNGSYWKPSVWPNYNIAPTWIFLK